MGDQSPHNTMNIDLNLAPVVYPPQDDHPRTITFEDWLLGSMREMVTNRRTARQRLPPVWTHIPLPIQPENSTADDDDDERPPQTIKTNENDDKINGDEGSFFDCNICLDLASEPVVTCCGHLFCWPCIYRWLFVHSDSKECPICKGEVTIKTLTPIYSRGNCTRVPEVIDSNPTVKIPSRPQANRIESWRQSIQRNTPNAPLLEFIRRIDNRFELTRDPISNNPQEISSTPLLTRIFTSRGIRSGRDTVPATSQEATVDLRNRDDSIPNLTSAIFADSYFRDHPDERNQEDLPLIDRHSMSSVAAIIQSENETGETDSRVSVSPTSRRRRESSSSRVSDVDSGDSRSTRRRMR